MNKKINGFLLLECVLALGIIMLMLVAMHISFARIYALRAKIYHYQEEIASMSALFLENSQKQYVEKIPSTITFTNNNKELSHIWGSTSGWYKVKSNSKEPHYVYMYDDVSKRIHNS